MCLANSSPENYTTPDQLEERLSHNYFIVYDYVVGKTGKTIVNEQTIETFPTPLQISQFERFPLIL